MLWLGRATKPSSDIEMLQVTELMLRVLAGQAELWYLSPAVTVTDIVIEPRFRGPPDSANGGYTCAMAAQVIHGPAQVTLRTPPPLGRPLAGSRSEDGTVRPLGGDRLGGEGRPAAGGRGGPGAVGVEQARRAAERCEWLEHHPYPTCFVCGPQRDAGDGLRIFPGPVEGRALYAAPWVPDESLADSMGLVRPEFVWAALDCPSGIVTD